MASIILVITVLAMGVPISQYQTKIQMRTMKVCQKEADRLNGIKRGGYPAYEAVCINTLQ